jgi:GDP-L-fucose synthase
MKILITGGTSTVGKHLKQIMPPSNQVIYHGSKDCDLINYEETLKIFKDIFPDIIIHLAGVVGGIQDNINKPVDYIEQNVLINTNVVKAAYNAGVTKLIALSSTCAYPDRLDKYPMVEEDIFQGPPTPTNFGYAHSKRCMIAHIEAYNKQFNTKYCYITPSNLYSELDNHKQNKAHYVTALVDKILEQDVIDGNTINLLGTGTPLRQFTYTGDIADILKTMIDNNILQSFNVSTPETYSIHELATITLKALNKDHWGIIYSSPELDGQYRKDVSVEKMNKIIPGFIFTTFSDGIKKVYNSKKQIQ